MVESHRREDWNFLQAGGTWEVQFDVASIPAGATAASLVLDVAGTDGVSVSAALNGSDVGSADFPYDDASIDRDQPHGVLQSGRIEVPLSELQVGANTLELSSDGRLAFVPATELPP